MTQIAEGLRGLGEQLIAKAIVGCAKGKIYGATAIGRHQQNKEIKTLTKTKELLQASGVVEFKTIELEIQKRKEVNCVLDKLDSYMKAIRV